MKLIDIIPNHKTNNFRKSGHGTVSNSFMLQIQYIYRKHHFPKNLEIRLERHMIHGHFEYYIVVIVKRWETEIDYQKETHKVKDFFRRLKVDNWRDMKKTKLIRAIGFFLESSDIIKLKLENQ